MNMENGTKFVNTTTGRYLRKLSKELLNEK